MVAPDLDTTLSRENAWRFSGVVYEITRGDGDLHKYV